MLSYSSFILEVLTTVAQLILCPLCPCTLQSEISQNSSLCTFRIFLALMLNTTASIETTCLTLLQQICKGARPIILLVSEGIHLYCNYGLYIFLAFLSWANPKAYKEFSFWSATPTSADGHHNWETAIDT